MRKIFVSLMIVLLIFISCTKESSIDSNSKIVNNNGKPSDPNFKYDIIELFKVDYIDKGIMSIDDIETAEQGDIYILDSKSCKVFHTNKIFDVTNIIGRKGQGPGEFENPFDLNIIIDSLIVIDAKLKRISIFGKDDKFIRSEKMIESTAWIKDYNNTYFGLSTSNETVDEKHYVVQKINTFNNKFEMTSAICEKRKYIRNPRINVLRIMKTAVEENDIYVCEATKKDIKIDVFNLKGNIVRSIRDKAPIVKISNAEIKELTEKYSQYGFDKDVINEIIFANGKEKDTVKEIYLDKNNYLWVMKTIKNQQNKDQSIYSIYVDGVYTKDIIIPLPIEQKLFFENDKIYAVYDGIITVFGYPKY